MSNDSDSYNMYIELKSLDGSDSIISSNSSHSPGSDNPPFYHSDHPHNDHPYNDCQDKANNLIIDEIINNDKKIFYSTNNNYDCNIDSQNVSSSESEEAEESRNGSSEDYYDTNVFLTRKDQSEDLPKSKYDHLFSNILLIKIYLTKIKRKTTDYIPTNKILIFAYLYIFLLPGIYLLTIHKNLITYIDIYKYMELKHLLFLLGPLVGVGAFLAGTMTMNGIYFRPDADGKNVFTIDSLKEFIVSPFQVGTPKFNILWGNIPGVDWKIRLKMLQLNWVAMVGLGVAFSGLLFLML